ncbi:AAA domain-containing protein [Streptomyces yunnanensis]|uniref:AAA domain-containing protein n=1 Tax=Streptomyces yunnanensis TaxID=156453 RepID=A0ABY8AAQ9_9ACTN|nr:AAA domain-containing protein [Streptomyces yunnanensis]WEB40617.1 AAA domain-containing protein [Streptomyces yunnanensis]
MGAVNRSRAERQRQAQILRYWRAVEYFSPPKVDPANPSKNLFAVGPKRPLPWEPGSAISRTRSRPNLVWQHTVYAGIFAVDKVRDVLLQAFRAPESEQDFDGRIGGDSAVLCFTVNQDGLLIKDSVTLSSCAWAVGQTLHPGPHSDQWLTGFDEDSTQRLLDLGDGRIDVDRRPVAGSASPQSGLGPVAGLMSRLVVSAAKGGLGAAAGAVGAGLGPVAGAVAAKVIEQVGGDLIDSAAARFTDHPQGDSAVSGQGLDSGEVEEAEQREAEPEGPPPEVGTKVLDVYDLAAITRWVAEQLGVAEVLLPNAIRVKSYQVAARHADEAGGDVFLNSFYADDLEQVAGVLEAGQAGTALLDYLRAEADLDAMNRFDVRRLPEIVLESVQPSSMPLGRWPADADKPLVLSQQFAVNRILASLGQDYGRGLYAVNGPPGTGKTTMLRDLIAALVVQRAERLAVLERPEDAFARKPRTWRTEENAGKTYPRTIHPLIPELTGFEIVIASSNNGAVENVTLEVPGARAIGDAWQGRADYLAGPASLALEEDAWGAIAARLGRRSNRSDFVQRFWWGDQAKGTSRPRPEASDDRPLLGLHKILQLQANYLSASSQNAQSASPDADAAAPLGQETWTQAVRRFTQARSHVHALAAERQEIADLLTRLAGPDALLDELVAWESGAHDTLLLLQQEQRRVEDELAGHREEHARRQGAMSAERRQLDLAEAAVRYGEEGVRAAESALHAHDAGKPGLIRRLVTREPMRRWETGRLPLQADVEAADARLAELESARVARHAAMRSAQGELDQALGAIMRTEARLTACKQARERQVTTTAEAGQQVARRRREREAEQRRLAAAKGRWGDCVPGAEWRAALDDRQAMETREQSAPWMDAAFAEARSELFLAALDLHRALLATAPERMRKNLQAVMEVVKGQAPADLDAETVLAAWQLLFVVVPVVSTTFASVGRMFAQLGSEALGWLFVDEAGQAAPQEVVGALWRARRAVVVGDPLQLEPVVTLPWTGQRRLAGHFAVDRQWAPAAASVQALSDRLNPYGTWLKDQDGEDIWLGSPLRVHRRCDRLMFDISNKIAYDGMMVYGVHRDQDDFPLAQRSVWWDVRALPGEEKWNPEEGRALKITLDLIRTRIDEAIRQERPHAGEAFPGDAVGGDSAAEWKRRLNDSVFVISPFRDVVHGLGKVAGGPLTSKRYGTVHTTQGKEADIVILVLGTGAGQVGSRNWAAQKPNLLNVAVTRARRRLIVIGDLDAWSRHRYFKDLAQHELIHRWTPER